jgi:DNA-binding NarL/FixJ family response regulator
MASKAQSRRKSQIVVVDDHPVLRDGLIQLISGQPDLDFTGTADNTADAKQLLEESAPDLMILDRRLKSGDALDLIKTLRVEHPDVKVLVLSQYDELIFAERTLRAGALGYVMKENATEELLRAIKKVLGGDIYVSERLAATFVRRSLERKPIESRVGIERLSDRELQVFQLIAASYSTREIADEFGLSIKTIETHRENIKWKLGLQNGGELNRFAEAWAAKNLLPFTLEPETTGRGDPK